MFEGAVFNYTGLSTDTKPTSAAGVSVPNGSRWREIDTEKVWTYHKPGDTWYLSSLRLDSSTHTLQVIDYAHHEIHAGSHYYIQGFQTLEDGPDIYRVSLTTPGNTTWSHFQWKISSTGITLTTLDEDATGGMGNGNPVTPLNNNRNSTDTSGMVLSAGCDAADSYVTRLENDKWGTSGFKVEIGGGSSRDDEIILKQGKTYLRTFTSYSTTNIIQFKASWYEHADKA